MFVQPKFWVTGGELDMPQLVVVCRYAAVQDVKFKNCKRLAASRRVNPVSWRRASPYFLHQDITDFIEVLLGEIFYPEDRAS